MKQGYILITLLFICSLLSAQVPFKTSFDFDSWPSDWSNHSLAKDGGWQLFQKNSTSVTNIGFLAGGDWSYAYTADMLCHCDKSEDLLIIPGVYTNEKPWIIVFEYFMPGVALNSASKESLSLVYSVDKGITWEEIESFKPTQNKEWQQVKVALSAANAKENIQLAIRYSDGGGQAYGAAIDNMVVTPANANSITVKSASKGEVTGWIGKPLSVSVEISNLSNEPLTKLIKMVNNQGVVWMDGVEDINIQPFETQIVEVPISVTSEGSSLYHICIEATPASGIKENEEMTVVFGDKIEYSPQAFVYGFDVVELEIQGIQAGSVTHGILTEEATGTWCGWCPRGAVIMDQLAEEFSDFIPVAVHNSDPMVNTEYDSWMSNSVDGYPSGHVQRRTTKVDPLGFEEAYNSAKAIPPSADMTMQFQYDDQTRVLDVTLTATYLINAFSHRFNVILTEDNLSGSAGGWSQSNYYAGGGEGPMGGYENLPNPVPANQMVYDHVARALLGTPAGLNGSIPFQAKKNETYSYTFNYTIPAEWNPNNVNVIGVLHNDGNKTINTAITASLLASGISDLPKGLGRLDLFPNPSNGSTNLRINLDYPQPVRVQIVDILGRLVAEKDYGMQSGDQIYSIQTGEWPNGLYQVVLHLGTDVVSRTLVISGR